MHEGSAVAYASWKKILIWGMFLPPVAVYLLAGKLKGEHDRFSANSIGALTFGAFYVFAGIGSAEVSVEASMYVFVSLLFVVCGIYLICQGIKFKRIDNVYEKYKILVERGYLSLNNMAAANSQTYEETCRSLKKLLNQGLFPGYRLDLEEGMLVSPETVERGRTVVECPHCGAVNTFFGESGKCEYCGSPLASD